MQSLRERIPFKFSEDSQEPEGSRVLDEQEQEEVIEDLHKTHRQSAEYHYKFLQGCLSFMILLHLWFLITPQPITPIHIIIPTSRTPRPPLIPLATGFALLNILLLLNLVVYLPQELSFPRVILSITSKTRPYIPSTAQKTLKYYTPLPLRWILGLLFVPLLVSVLTLTDVHQIIWWSSPLLTSGLFLLVRAWILENEAEIEKLEKLRYEAKGA